MGADIASVFVDQAAQQLTALGSRNKFTLKLEHCNKFQQSY